MENIVFVFQIGSFLILTGGIIWIVFSDKKKISTEKLTLKIRKNTYVFTIYMEIKI